MNKKNHRLRRVDAHEVFKKGKLYHSPSLMIRVLNVSSWNEVAFTITVSKKVEKSAVLRNRSKRRLYSAFKVVLQSTHNPHKGVIILKKSILQTPFREVCHEMADLVKKAGL